MTRKIYFQLVLLAALTLSFANKTNAQFLLNSDSAYKANTPNTGRLWGYMFGDAYYKAHSDTLSRGGSNQYTGIPKDRSAFQFRRIYLGYDYNISKKFSAELLLAAEDNFPTGNPVASTSPSGDLTSNGKLTFYIKLANLRWKGIWKGTDLVVGQMSTPAFPMTSEKVWSYRSVERTLTDIRRTPSFDLGVALQGVFDEKQNYGYNVMIANGTSAKPETDNLKWFYGDVWAKFFDKKITVDLYADYARLNWNSNWHHSRQMTKGFISYSVPKITVGVEGFLNVLHNDEFATRKTGGVDTITSDSKGISVFVRGPIIKDKLNFFARYDAYSPMNFDKDKYSKSVENTGNYNDNSFVGNTPTGDETYRQEFITAGLDFTPIKNVHFMPNIWYNHYSSQLSDAAGKAKGDYDLVYRMTFFFTFGK